MECPFIKLRLKVSTIFNNHFMEILSINKIEKQYTNICLIDILMEEAKKRYEKEKYARSL